MERHGCLKEGVEIVDVSSEGRVQRDSIKLCLSLHETSRAVPHNTNAMNRFMNNLFALVASCGELIDGLGVTTQSLRLAGH
ncbi:unnamed protein product [Victoria cruziana]